MQSIRLMPIVIVRTSRFSFSIISLVCLTSEKFIIVPPTPSDPVHQVKDLFFLALDLDADLFAPQRSQLLRDLSEGLLK